MIRPAVRMQKKTPVCMTAIESCQSNVASIRGFAPNVGRIAYCAPKAAVIMMTRVAAAEWARHGVRVNTVAPGFLRTPMWEADVERGAIDEGAYLDLVPAGRIGAASEVGKLVVYLLGRRRLHHWRLHHDRRRRHLHRRVNHK